MQKNKVGNSTSHCPFMLTVSGSALAVMYNNLRVKRNKRTTIYSIDKMVCKIKCAKLKRFSSLDDCYNSVQEV